MTKMPGEKAPLFLVVVVLTMCGGLATPTSGVLGDAVRHESGNEMTPTHSWVVIVGGGAAGVAAASRIMEANIMNLTILEAEDRLGGRIHSIPFGNSVVDLGAQWVHGVRGNVVYEMANPLGLLEENGTQYDSNTRFVQGNGVDLDPEVMKRMMNIVDSIVDDKALLASYSGSFGQLHDEKFEELAANLGLNSTMVNAYKNWMAKSFAFATGADSWYNVSTKWIAQYKISPGDQMVNWKNNGYYSVINLLMRNYRNPAEDFPIRNKTHLRTEVKTIHWGPKKVDGLDGHKVLLIETSDGKKFTADYVIVTVSLGVLKEKANTMFDPPLPEKQMNAIQHIGFGQVNKIYLHFNETWWPTNITGFSVIPTNEDRQRFNELYPQFMEKGEWISGLTGFFIVPRQPHHVLFDWIVGEPARNMEKYSDEEVKNGCVLWLQTFLNQTVPAPASFARSKWFSNPHFRGSYSHRSLDSVKHNAQYSDLAEPVGGFAMDLLFAGEATSDEHYSTVHGAVESGWREGDRIVDAFSF